MGAFSMQTVLFIIYTMLGFVAALAAIMVVTGIIRFLVRKALGRIEPDPNATTGTVKFLAHFLTGGRPAVRYGYSCSSDTSR